MVIDKVPITVVHPIRSSIRPRHIDEGDVSVTTTLHVAQVNIIVKMLFVKFELKSSELRLCRLKGSLHVKYKFSLK